MSNGSLGSFREREMKKYLSGGVLFFLLSIASVMAQDVKSSCVDSVRMETRVHFRFDSSKLDTTYLDNGSNLYDLKTYIDAVGAENIDTVLVIAQSSPEGVYEHNIKLSRLRANSMRQYFHDAYPELCDKLIVKAEGEAWTALREYVAADQRMKDATKEQVLQVIDADINVGTKKWRLEQLPIYRYLIFNYYSKLRHSAICVIVPKPQPEPEPKPEPEPEPAPMDSVAQAKVEDIVASDTIVPVDTVAQSPATTEKKEIFYLRSNLLVPAANFGAEMAIGNRWSIGADYYYPWVPRDASHKECFQFIAWGLDGKYWFRRYDHSNKQWRKRTESDCLEGHALGLNVSAGYYDFQRNYSGHQGEFINAGVDYLYALPIFKDRLHLEFSLGLGFIYSRAIPYDVFEDGGKAYRKGFVQNIYWLGPNKANVSLVLPITWGGKLR